MLIVADENRLKLTPWNIAYGNKISHLLFLVSLCAANNGELVIPCDSCLDDIFDLDHYKRKLVNQVSCEYREKTAFATAGRRGLLWKTLGCFPVIRSNRIKAVVDESRRQLENGIVFLDKNDLPKEFTVSGHFWHYKLMPSFEAYSRYLSIKKENIDKVLAKYPDISSSSSISVHMRDTDFSNHLDNIFTKTILVDDDYYFRAIKLVENRLGCGARYHLFSDNKRRIERIFEGKNYVLHDDDPVSDWVGLFMSRNIIQSNSTFCWTASLYNKFISVQPAGGYNYNHGGGNVPCGFLMPFSCVLDVCGNVSGVQDGYV